MAGHIDWGMSLHPVHTDPRACIEQGCSSVLHMSAEQPHKGGRQAGSIWRPDWLITEDPYQYSKDWDQPDIPNEPKAPGWVRAMAIFVLPILLWMMIIFIPFVLLSILTLLGFLFYWWSRRSRTTPRGPFIQREPDCRLSADADTNGSGLGQPSHGNEADDDRPPPWLPVIMIMGLLFWLSVGVLVARYLSNGAGS